MSVTEDLEKSKINKLDNTDESHTFEEVYLLGSEFKCDLCDTSFDEETELKDHIKSVHGHPNASENVTPIKCDDSKDQKSPSTVIHIRRKFACQTCGEKFCSRQGLSRHKYSIHLGRKKYECDDCHKCFASRGDLKRHVDSVHKGIKEQKKHKCEKCDKRFTQKHALKSHIYAIHLKLKPFQCDVCDTFFSERGSLKHHLRSTHGISNHYKCDVCDARFMKRVTLLEHQRHSHERPTPNATVISVKKEEEL